MQDRLCQKPSLATRVCSYSDGAASNIKAFHQKKSLRTKRLEHRRKQISFLWAPPCQFCRSTKLCAVKARYCSVSRAAADDCNVSLRMCAVLTELRPLHSNDVLRGTSGRGAQGLSWHMITLDLLFQSRETGTSNIPAPRRLLSEACSRLLPWACLRKLL